MAKKYNFSATYPVADGFSETLQIVDCDSFDEAIKIVEKEVKLRLNELQSRGNKQAAKVVEPPQKEPIPALPDMVQTFSDRDMEHEVPNNAETTGSQIGRAPAPAPMPPTSSGDRSAV